MYYAPTQPEIVAKSTSLDRFPVGLQRNVSDELAIVVEDRELIGYPWQQGEKDFWQGLRSR